MVHSDTSFLDDPTDAGAGTEHLLSALNDSDLQVRARAAWTLGDRESQEPRTLAALIEALNDDEGYVCAAVCDALCKIGEPAVPALVEALQKGNGWVRSRAALTLGFMGERAKETISALLTAQKDRDPRVRVEAVGALLFVQSEEPPPIVILIEGLQSDHVNARYRAAYFLSCLGAKAKAAIPALVSALRDDDRAVRENAAEAIGLIGPDAVEAVADLITLLSDPYRNIRENAADALGQIGWGANPAIVHLEKVTVDHRLVRWKATKAIAAIENDTHRRPPSCS